MKRIFIIALAIISITFVLASCDIFNNKKNNDDEGDGDGDSVLSGSITISPNSGVTTGTPLTAVYSGGESVSYRWNKNGAALSPAETKTTYTPAEAGSYTVTVSAAGYQSKTSAAVAVTAARLTMGSFTGSYTASNKTIIFTNADVTANNNVAEWAVIVGEDLYANGTYTYSGDTAALEGIRAEDGAVLEDGATVVEIEGTAVLSNNGNTLTVSAGNGAAINGTYTKQAGGAFRIKITGLPSNVISKIKAGTSPGIDIAIHDSTSGSHIAGRESVPSGWGDIIGADSYEVWMFDPVANRVYYFGTPGNYDIEFTASELSIFKYKRAVPLKVNEVNTIAYASFSDTGISLKTLSITGITDALMAAGQDGFMVGVFREGTTPEQAMSRTNFITGADADSDGITMSEAPAPYTATISLFADWTGIATCDIYLMLGSDGDITYYKAANVSFSPATVTVDAATFAPVTIP